MVAQTKDPIATVIETSDRGDRSLSVNITDQTTAALDIYFLETLNMTTIAADVAVDDTAFTATTGHGIVIGDVVEIANLDIFIQAIVLNVTVDVIDIDTPINHAYLSGSTLVISNKNMNVVGTAATPRVFSILPGPAQSGDITRMILNILDGSAMDFSTFGGIGALTNGCVLRVKKEDGDFINLFNWKTNGEFIIRSFDHSFQTKTGGGLHSFAARSTWAGQSKRGVSVRIDGERGEEIQLLIRDDLSALSFMSVVAQGHELQQEN